jgi:hypothetical protein
MSPEEKEAPLDKPAKLNHQKGIDNPLASSKLHHQKK